MSEHEELKKVIRDGVSEGINDAFIRIGIDLEDVRGMQADMRYLRQAREGSEDLAKWGKRSAIGAGITALGTVVWLGIKGALQ